MALRLSLPYRKSQVNSFAIFYPLAKSAYCFSSLHSDCHDAGVSAPFVARHYRTGELISVSVEAGRYAAIAPYTGRDDPARFPTIAPGLVDLQVNGFAGSDFNRAEGLTPEAWERACRALLGDGCTAFLATVITHSAAETEALLALLAARIAEAPFNCIGIHLEGPFLNPDAGTRGAHDPNRMIPADEALFIRWQAVAGGHIRRITLAPEIAPEASLPFIRARVAEGVRISIGHSAAMGETLREAVAAGASCWTHLGNAVPRQVDKFENVILHALAEDRLAVSLIPDGQHIPPHAFRALARALGPRLHLTTDAMAGAGIPMETRPPTATLGYQTVELDKKGRAVLPGSGRLAGSTLIPFPAPFVASAISGLSRAECWDAFSLQPASWIGNSHGLEVGNSADFVLFTSLPHSTNPQLEGISQDDFQLHGESFKERTSHSTLWITKQ